MSCESCNTCQASCTRCQGCNKCQTCNTCEVICESCQTYGQVNGGGFSWTHCATAGQSISPSDFGKSDWQNLVNYINKARGKGSHVSTGGTISDPTTSNLDPFSAFEFNRVADEVGGVQKGDKTKISAGDVIYGSYFTDLKDAASSAKISYNACNTRNACDSCNTSSCQVDCDSCEGCNSNTQKDCCEKSTDSGDAS